MLFHVEMTVTPPAPGQDMKLFDRLKLEEKELAQTLQNQGVWRHLWRVAGRYANVSIFDVADNAALHELLMSLPLFPFMTVTVTPLCRHPSSIREDDS